MLRRALPPALSRLRAAANLRASAPVRGARGSLSFGHLPCLPLSRGFCVPPPPPSPPEKEARMHIAFTCTRCDTRVAKGFSKAAYTRGVVLVTCPGCDGRHLIADNLGWFGEEKNVEEVMKKKGGKVVTVRDGEIDYAP